METPDQPPESLRPSFPTPWLSKLQRTHSGISAAEPRVVEVREVDLEETLGPGLPLDSGPELPLMPSTLDRILVKRNAQLVLQIEKQQNKFLQSLRVVKNLPSPPKVESLPTPAAPEEPKVFAADTKETERKDDDANTCNLTRQLTPQSGSGNRQLKSQTISDLALFAAAGDFRGEEEAHEVKMKKRKHGSSRSDEYEAAKQVSFKKQAVLEQSSRYSSNASATPTVRDWLQRLTNSKRYQAFTACVLAVNCIYIGVEVDYMAASSNKNDGPFAFVVISWIFAAWFTVELIINFLASGTCTFIWGRDWHWNWLDTFVVITSIIDVLMGSFLTSSPSSLNTSQLRVLRVLRLIRLARVVRIMRLVKALRALRTLCHSIICTMRSLVWAMVLIVMIVYVFGIVFTTVVTAHLADHPSPWPANSEEAVLHEIFGSLHRSIHSLFRSISGGLTWNIAADALAKVSWFWAYLFTSYVSFLLFAVLNVMTGVFCHAAIESAQRDKEMAVQNVLMNRQRFEGMLMDLFRQIDEDGSGKITIGEFEGHFEDEAVKFLLHGLELEVEDAWTLFNLLDQDGDHDIDAGEFLDGCMHLKGNAKALEVAKVKRRTEAGLNNIISRLEGLEAAHRTSTHETARALHHVTALLERRGEFSEF